MRAIQPGTTTSQRNSRSRITTTRCSRPPPGGPAPAQPADQQGGDSRQRCRRNARTSREITTAQLSATTADDWGAAGGGGGGGGGPPAQPCLHHLSRKACTCAPEADCRGGGPAGESPEADRFEAIDATSPPAAQRTRRAAPCRCNSKTVNQQPGRMAWIPNAPVAGHPCHRQTAYVRPNRCRSLRQAGRTGCHNRKPIRRRRTLNYCEAYRPRASRQRFFQAQLHGRRDLGPGAASWRLAARCGCSTLCRLRPNSRPAATARKASPKRCGPHDADPRPCLLSQPGPPAAAAAHSVRVSNTHGPETAADCLSGKERFDWSISSHSAARGPCCPGPRWRSSFRRMLMWPASEAAPHRTTNRPPRSAAGLRPGPSAS